MACPQKIGPASKEEELNTGAGLIMAGVMIALGLKARKDAGGASAA